MKQIIRLTESDLRRIVMETYKRAIKEDILGNDWNALDRRVNNNYEPFEDQKFDDGENDFSVAGEEQIDPTQYNPNDVDFKR
jgi:hypothetical protein